MRFIEGNTHEGKRRQSQRRWVSLQTTVKLCPQEVGGRQGPWGRGASLSLHLSGPAKGFTGHPALLAEAIPGIDRLMHEGGGAWRQPGI